MKRLLLLGFLTFSSCFWGPDTYEKAVNDYFFLYSDDYSTWDVCLGTVHEGGIRIGDAYLCLIKRIGWDDSFLICETKIDGYYIQDLRYLQGKDPSQFRNALLGPYEKSDLEAVKDSLGINKELQLDISY